MLVRDGEHPNLVRYAFQEASALGFETEPGARDKIADSVRHQHLTASSLSRYARCCMNGYSSDVLTR